MIGICIAHFVGLLATGLYGSIGTSAGFGSGVGAAMFLGVIISIPWFAVLAVAVAVKGDWLDRHLLILLVFGPVVVCASYALLAGAFIDAVAVACSVDSLTLALFMRGPWQTADRKAR